MIPPLNYCDKNREDKICYWVGILYRSMRWVGEEGYEEISIFDKNLLTHMKKVDPNIDVIMPLILSTLSKMWMEDANNFIKKVNRQLGTHYEFLDKP